MKESFMVVVNIYRERGGGGVCENIQGSKKKLLHFLMSVNV